ncbi:MAG: prepilin-type N-terminal cleavage/methylation domain-containing protein [Synergistaceae bacterium]|nr:prepilin-type N-terminal cleavage/methylation domain-containing protein [Synergistaceae bacterium]
MAIKGKKPAFTLIEMIIAIIIIAILSSILFLAYSYFIDKARANADQASVHTLNVATRTYSLSCLDSINNGDIFSDVTGDPDDTKKIDALVKANCLLIKIQPQQKGAKFQWLKDKQLWSLKLHADEPPLTPLGSTFQEISTAMIEKMIQRLIDKGSYGSTWGDKRWTDIGLIADDWKNNPINHISYSPNGGTLRITPENGYSLFIDDTNGNTRELKGSSNWSLIYNDPDKKWYYHSVSPANEVLISTIVLP